MTFFSICIPNYNYANYIGTTIRSVLDQTIQDFEVVISDNASNDESVNVIRDLQNQDGRIRYRINNCNVGFAPNLDRAASMAQGKWMTLLSSDDLMHSECLEIYRLIIDHFGEGDNLILSSSQDVIDSKGNRFNYISIDWKLWKGAEKDAYLSRKTDADVWVIDAATLLRNSLIYMRTPFAFASTTYPAKLYNRVEGYCQGGIINPDKKFAWALLGVAHKAIFVDRPLVKYRVHNSNQGSQQAKSGALKHLVDEYVSTFQLSDSILSKAQLKREDVEKAFIEQDIVLRGMNTLSEGNITLAKRMLHFGKATYKRLLLRNKKYWAFYFLVILGPIGVYFAKLLKAKYLNRYQAGTSF